MLLLLVCLWSAGMRAQSYSQQNDISYTAKTDAYAVERLKLDVYHPEGRTACPVVVWFHGGGLEGGNKEIPLSTFSTRTSVAFSDSKSTPNSLKTKT